MFDRFSDHTKSAMNKARQQSQRLNHEYLGTEHILLGLLDVIDCRANEMLESLQITPDRVRSEVDKLIQSGSTLVTMGQLPFTPGAKNVLMYTMEEAGALGSTFIGTEHLLLGLARETEGVASKALSACGMSLDKARALAGRTPTRSGDHRSEGWRRRVLEDAVDALAELQESDLAAKVREVARKHGSRKWDR